MVSFIRLYNELLCTKIKCKTSIEPMYLNNLKKYQTLNESFKIFESTENIVRLWKTGGVYKLLKGK